MSNINVGIIGTPFKLSALTMAIAVAIARAPKDFKIQGSNDGVTFDDIATFTDVTGWALSVPKVFNLLTKTYI